MKKAFSLVELLVVIGIIAVLAGVLLSTFGGGTESARSAQCMANMKNLANACYTYATSSTAHPMFRAQSTEYVEITGNKRSAQRKYYDNPGWVSWDSQGKYPSSSSMKDGNGIIGMYESDPEKAQYALTNGCIWTSLARNRKSLVCPSHAKKMGKDSQPLWSYLMNSWFSSGNISKITELERADRRLLFSEVPFMEWHSWIPSGSGGSTDTDGVLQYAPSSGENNSGSGTETIGANHVSGRKLYAHVVFADGHTEKLVIPTTGSVKHPKLAIDLKELTTWLCEGEDVSFDGQKYQPLDK